MQSSCFYYDINPYHQSALMDRPSDETSGWWTVRWWNVLESIKVGLQRVGLELLISQKYFEKPFKNTFFIFIFSKYFW